MRDNQSDPGVLPFPAEIRLEIYRCLIRREYLAVKTIPEHCFYHPNWNYQPPAVPAGLVILRVSRATSAEALKLLYEESIFVFKLDFTTPFTYDMPSYKAVVLMRNVRFELSAKETSPKDRHAKFFVAIGGSSKQALMIQRTMALFTGTSCLRYIMKIRFRDCIIKNPHCMPYAFTQAMQKLGGFQKLVVEFEFPNTLEQDASELGFYTECKRYKNVFLKDDFEPAYGPAIEHAAHVANKYICYLEFRPRQHLTGKLIAKVGSMLEEAARLSARSGAGERTVAALHGVAETMIHV